MILLSPVELGLHSWSLADSAPWAQLTLNTTGLESHHPAVVLDPVRVVLLVSMNRCLALGGVVHCERKEAYMLINAQ